MTQELTATSIVALFDTNKEQRQSFVSALIADIKEGNRNPLDIHMQIKCMDDIVKQITANDEYRAILLEEAGKYGKSFEYKNAKVETKETGVKYDYSQCNDEIYNAMVAEAENLSKRIKQREKMLQTIPASGMADPESGAMIYPASKSSTTTVAVTLK